MLSVTNKPFKLGVIMLNVIMLNVMAPPQKPKYYFSRKYYIRIIINIQTLTTITNGGAATFSITTLSIMTYSIMTLST